MKKLLNLDSVKVLTRAELKNISAGFVFYKCKNGGGSGSSSTATLEEAAKIASNNCNGGYTLFEF